MSAVIFNLCSHLPISQQRVSSLFVMKSLHKGYYKFKGINFISQLQKPPRSECSEG